MDAVRIALVLLLAVVVSRILARLSPIRLPLPILQIGIGAALSYMIGFRGDARSRHFLSLVYSAAALFGRLADSEGRILQRLGPHSHTRVRDRRVHGDRARTADRDNYTCDTAFRRLRGRSHPLANRCGCHFRDLCRSTSSGKAHAYPRRGGATQRCLGLGLLLLRGCSGIDRQLFPRRRYAHFFPNPRWRPARWDPDLVWRLRRIPLVQQADGRRAGDADPD